MSLFEKIGHSALVTGTALSLAACVPEPKTGVEPEQARVVYRYIVVDRYGDSYYRDPVYDPYRYSYGYPYYGYGYGSYPGTVYRPPTQPNNPPRPQQPNTPPRRDPPRQGPEHRNPPPGRPGQPPEGPGHYTPGRPPEGPGRYTPPPNRPPNPGGPETRPQVETARFHRPSPPVTPKTPDRPSEPIKPNMLYR